MDSTLFEMWFEKCLLPYFKKDTVIIMDNASFHIKNNFLKYVKKYKFNLIFLLPYSPELNPIKKYRYILKHRIKTFLRHHISLSDSIHYAFLCLYSSIYKHSDYISNSVHIYN